MSKKVITVVGTRPNFIKVTQLKKYFDQTNPEILHKIIHTGQHYDDRMSKIFFKQFNLSPDIWLDISSGSPNSQIANIMLKLESVFLVEKPDLVIVVGDVNSTLAAALAAHKCNIQVAHLESGLRSGDKGMPEENNRILTDAITSYFFITEQSGWNHLIAENKPKKNLFFVGNTMIDTLVAFETDIQKSEILKNYNIKKDEYALMTMHRPATVDNKEGLLKLLEIINTITVKRKLIFPIHPRTKKRFKEFGLEDELRKIKNLILADPMGYFSFQKLIKDCKFVITDSGGIQEETTYRQIPCLTLRPNTERPSTTEIGTNVLIPTFNLEEIRGYISDIEKGYFKKGEIPTLWDGNATARILQAIKSILYSETLVTT